jgi:hypothetical protein
MQATSAENALSGSVVCRGKIVGSATQLGRRAHRPEDLLDESEAWLRGWLVAIDNPEIIRALSAPAPCPGG